MAVSGIPCGSANLPLPHPATARGVHGRAPVEDSVTTCGPRDGSGDPDDTGYAADPADHRRVDIMA